VTVVSTTEVKTAGRRLCVGAVFLAAASAVYYFSDEVSFAYREVDGYLPVLWIVRLGALIVAMGLLFAIVYPVRVLAVRGPLALRARRRTAATPNGAGRSLRLERTLDTLLCLLVLGCAYLLVKPALIEALLPLRGVGRIGLAFTIACAVAGVILLVALVWLALGLLPSRRSAAPPSERPCGACGAANPPQAAFCRACGAGLQGSRR
jgi:hypothetical protein